MKTVFSFFIFLFCISIHATQSQIAVQYLSNKPVIDGVWAWNENFFPNELHKLKIIKKSDSENLESVVKYYTGYNEEFLYLYIESTNNRITKRDRAYQNGDGFHIMIGKPFADSAPTDEFYLLGFSPKEKWCNKFVWYYNIDLSFEKLNDQVQFKSKEYDNHTSFELLIPWSEIHPYHPMLSAEIGFNLCYVEAVDKGHKNYYFIKHDPLMQSEQSKRQYINLNFEKPKKELSIAAQLSRNNISNSDSLSLRVSAYCSKDTSALLRINVRSGENQQIDYIRETVDFKKGRQTYNINIPTKVLPEGGYTITYSINDQYLGKNNLSVLPDFDSDDLHRKLNNLSEKLKSGSINTLLFYMKSIQRKKNELKPYETSFKLRKSISELHHLIAQGNLNNDILRLKKGYFQRGFKSKQDSLYRPYSIIIPDSFDPRKQYPLLVYLHGSGDDDRVLERTPLPSDDFITIAPNGRGTSNCFATESAQMDIQEAIDDVIQNYNIDTNNIILSGFSMGGYGVYRTYFQNPKLYKALAVISGHPDLARKWINENELNFLEKENQTVFKDVPMFIFHGENDLNCPYTLTKDMVNSMSMNNPLIKFVTERGGHGGMSEESREKYYLWLEKQISEKDESNRE